MSLHCWSLSLRSQLWLLCCYTLLILFYLSIYLSTFCRLQSWGGAHLYNSRHSRVRHIIENTFGILAVRSCGQCMSCPPQLSHLYWCHLHTESRYIPPNFTESVTPSGGIQDGVVPLLDVVTKCSKRQMFNRFCISNFCISDFCIKTWPVVLLWQKNTISEDSNRVKQSLLYYSCCRATWPIYLLN